MLISTPTELLSERYGRERTLQLIAEAGFDAYDMTLCDMARPDCEFLAKNWRERAQYYRAVADKLGLVCNQAHAPFPSSYEDGVANEQRIELIERAMEIAAILGAKIIVVHPVQHLPYIRYIEQLKTFNKVFYSRLLMLAEKLGITIATENMWQVMKMWMNGGWANEDLYYNPIVDSTCSSAEEFAEYVDMMGSDRLVACLDIGHVPLVQRDLPHMIRTLGPRLQALHVHDNDGKSDWHTFPFSRTGVVDFDAVTTALAEIGYEGDITFEANSFFLRVPEALVPSALRYLCDIGRYLRDEIQRKKA